MSYFLNLTSELKETNSTNVKKEILKKYDNEKIRKALFYIYNPYYKYGITIEGFKTFRNSYNENIKGFLLHLDVFDLLDALREGSLTGHAALIQVGLFERKSNPEDVSILFCALNKGLDSPLWVSTINAVFKEEKGEKFIPEFEVARAHKLEDILKKRKLEMLDFKHIRYVASRKMDGIRVISIYKDKDLKFYSREGNEFLALGKLKDTLLPILQEIFKDTDIVLDGELCIFIDWQENFKQVTKEFRGKNHTIENPMLVIFDIISEKAFQNEKGDTKFEERLNYLQSLKEKLTTQYSSLLEFSPVLDEEIYSQWHNRAIENNWEGLILRDLDSIYEGKRTDSLVKVKKSQDAEFIVEDVTMSYQGILQEDGTVKDMPILANVHIRYKDNIVYVGTGFSQEERLHFYKHKEDIIGKKITVQYMEESIDKDGKYSLRHPSFKGIRDYE